MNDPKNAIEMEDVRKVFHIDKSGPAGFKHRNVGEKIVLDGFTLSVRKGECLGIVGRNGSGKSTTLKMMSRILSPDSGRIEIDGKVASILELGMGFNPDFTGTENIYLKCSMFGFSEKETSNILERIVDFTGLGEQIDDPVRTYSSGMNARLAFAIAVNVSCDIIILDEVLSVGDAGFRSKCANIFKQMKKEGKTIILASHSMGTIASMCDRAIWIDKGKVRETGDPHTVSAHFEKDLTESYDTVLSLAQSGDTSAMCKLAVMLRDGYNVEKNVDEAERWFVKAADLGNIEAMIELGSLLASRDDVEGATARFRTAAEAGSQEAQIRLIEISDVLDDTAKKAVLRLKELAEEGNVRAMYHYADALQKGTAVTQDKHLAHEWFVKAAELDDVNSMLQVGLDYRDGIGATKDADEAEKWLTEAANCNNTRAKLELAKMYRLGLNTDVNMTKAIHWLTKAAYVGDTGAMSQLGTIYRDGAGIEKNQAQADIWFSLLAKQNRLLLMHNLADILRQWNRCEKDYYEAAEWYEKASEGGLIASDFILGLMFKDGNTIPPDSQKALHHFAKAAKHGHAQSAYEYANLRIHIYGANDDDAEKAAFMSAKSGNPFGRYVLGIIRATNTKTPSEGKNDTYWLERSSELGHVGARNVLCRKTHHK